jgi:hypothetical protein
MCFYLIPQIFKPLIFVKFDVLRVPRSGFPRSVFRVSRSTFHLWDQTPPVNQLTNQPINQLTNQPVNQLTN